MSDTINWKFDNDKYDSSLNLDEFAFEITKDLRRISYDKYSNDGKGTMQTALCMGLV